MNNNFFLIGLCVLGCQEPTRDQCEEKYDVKKNIIPSFAHDEFIRDVMYECSRCGGLEYGWKWLVTERGICEHQGPGIPKDSTNSWCAYFSTADRIKVKKTIEAQK